MSETPDQAQELDPNAMLQEAVRRISHAVELRNEMHIRIAKRVTAIIRIGMISLGIVGIAMVLLVFMLSYKMNFMIQAMQTMNSHFRSMSDNMSQMRILIVDMEKHVRSMPTIVTEVEKMDSTVRMMRADIDTISTRMDTMNSKITQVGGNVARMTHTFNSMDKAVYGMGRDVNTMSAPMKNFNWMRSVVPFP
jgi:uncharacterized protein YoxC